MHYVNNWGRLRESWGRFIGERIRFLRVIEGLPAPLPLPTPKEEWAVGILFTGSIGTADCLAGGVPPGMSNVELEFCLADHMSSLGPGVSGVRTDQSAINKLTSIFGRAQKKLMLSWCFGIQRRRAKILELPKKCKPHNNWKMFWTKNRVTFPIRVSVIHHGRWIRKQIRILSGEGVVCL